MSTENAAVCLNNEGIHLRLKGGISKYFLVLLQDFNGK
jgi:hypothetical protein